MANQVSSSQTAESFLLSLGINTHIDYSTSSYANITTVENSLAYLGITHVRDDVPGAGASNLAPYQALAALGVSFDLVIPQGTVVLSTVIAALNSFESEDPGAIAAIEGANEVNDQPVTYNGVGGLAGAALLQQALYTAVKADPTLATIPVFNTTLGGGSASQYAQLGNLSAYANFSNAHIYPQGSMTPAQYIAATLPLEAVDAPSDPQVITEMGYTTMPTGVASWEGVSQYVQASYTLDSIMDANVDGVKSIYLYELLDVYADPGNTNTNDHLGLFNSDGTPKLAATAIHDLTTILADPGDTAATGSGVSYTLSGLPASGNSTEFVKANGASDIVVWAEPTIWNQTTDSQVTAPVSNVTVSLGGTFGTVNVYDPESGTAPIQTFSNTSSVTLSVTDHPLIVEVEPGTASGSTPPASGSTPPASGSTPTASEITATSGGTLTDAAANNWTLTSAGVVEENGTAVTGGSGGAALAIVSNVIYGQQASTNSWFTYSPTTKVWSSSGAPVLPTVTPVVTLNEITPTSGGTLTDAAANKWTLTSAGGVDENGTPVPGGSGAAALAIVGNVVYGEEAASAKWYTYSPATKAWSSSGAPLTSTATIAATQAGATISQSTISVIASSGNHMVFISGSDDTVNLSGGVNIITDTGNGNTYQIPAAAGGSDNFANNVLTDGDTLDLRSALAATTWNGSSSTLASYLTLTNLSQGSVLSIAPTSGALGVSIATINGASGTTLSSLLAHALT